MPIVVPCSSCGARVIWWWTNKGKRIQLDADPVADGNVYISAIGLANVMTGQDTIPAGAKRYKAHFATCPNAAKHRKAKGGDDATHTPGVC